MFPPCRSWIAPMRASNRLLGSVSLAMAPVAVRMPRLWSGVPDVSARLRGAVDSELMTSALAGVTVARAPAPGAALILAAMEET